jgi:4-amino-4-deoxy-L-arabinose transferase-like glycosyltransferase
MEQALSTNQYKKNSKAKEGTLKIPKEAIFLVISTLCAFFIRFFFIPGERVINGDGIYYATLGKKLVSGDFVGGLSAYWSPLFSLLVGISSLFFQDVEMAGRFVSVLIGAILMVPAYFLIKNLYGRQSAWWGTILLIGHPLLIKSSGWVMTESLYTLIFTTCVLSTWYALRDGRAKNFFLTGLLFGAAFLTKPEAIGFLGLLFVLTIGAKFFRRNIGIRRYATGYLFLLIGFAICFLPYFVYLHEKTGQWTISQKIMINFPAADYDGDLLKLINNRQITMLDRIWGDHYETDNRQVNTPSSEPKSKTVPSSGFWTKIISALSILGEKAAFLLIKQFQDYFPVLLSPLLMVVTLFGFFYQTWTRFGMIRWMFLFLFFICLIIGYALTAVELRYLFPLIPTLICWTANGIVGIGNWLAKYFSKVLKTKREINSFSFQMCILLVLVASLIPLFTGQFKKDEWQNVPFEEKQAGLWIKNNSDSASLKVMSSHATAAFYAGAKHLFIPNEDFSTVLEYARNQRVNYLVYSQRRLKNTPAAFPAEGQQLPPDLQIVYQDEQQANYKIIVYQLSN